jgi:hypothetical protein
MINNWSFQYVPRVEPGSNTTTEARRVAEGEEKEPSAWGYNWATVFLGI